MLSTNDERKQVSPKVNAVSYLTGNKFHHKHIWYRLKAYYFFFSQKTPPLQGIWATDFMNVNVKGGKSSKLYTNYANNTTF